jgi:phosphonate transport system substrate-binding protein
MRLASALAILALAFLAQIAPLFAAHADPAPKALQVVLVPADGGTEDGTRADFAPVFNAVSKTTGRTFDIRVGQSYAAAVEAICNGSADIAFLGPVTYVQARDRGCAELLAVAVENGKSVYYAGLFVRRDATARSIADLKGCSIAYGDINSSTSFTYPIDMILNAGLDPVADFAAIRLAGSHANSLAALSKGEVDVAALSFESFERAVNRKAIATGEVRLLARSEPIPSPPLAMSTKLPPELKAALRKAFEGVATAPGVTPDMIRGYGGGRVDRYDTKFPESAFDGTAGILARVDDALKGAILRKASQRAAAGK